MASNPRTLGTINLKLYIISCLRQHQTIQEIRKALGVSHSNLSYHLKKLRKLDVITRISYGVWEVKNHHVHRVYSDKKGVSKGQKELQKIGVGRSDIRGEGYEDKFEVLSSKKVVKQDSIACHGLMFTFSIPTLARWSKIGRREYLKSRNIGFVVLPHGERLAVKDEKGKDLLLNWKVQLFNKSLVLYAPVGFRWYGEDAYVAFSEGLFDALRVMKKVEKLLSVNLSWSGKYKWKTSREHHALLGNALAQQYTRNKEKLYVRDDKGLWCLIDASILDGELETVRAGIEGRDANKIVQDDFNQLKDTGATRQVLLDNDQKIQESLLRATELLEFYAENVATHSRVLEKVEKRMDRDDDKNERR